MKWFYNLKISAKLLIGFILVAIITGALGIWSIINIKALDKSDTIMYENMTVPISEMSDISTTFQRIRVNVRNMMLETDPEKIQAFSDRIDELSGEMDGYAAAFEETIISDEMRQAFNDFVAADVEFDKQVKIITQLAMEDKDAEAMAIMSETGTSGIASRAEQDAIDKIIEMKVADAKARSEANSKQASTTVMTTIIIIAVAMALSVLIGVFISLMISRPLKRTVDMINEMGKGHLGLRLNMGTKDEVGEMANAMDSFADDLQNNVIATMKRISEGDLDFYVTPKDDKDEISPALINTTKALKGLIEEAVMLSNAAIDGQLDARGNTEKYKGGYKEIIVGFNNTLDAVIGPLNVAAEYIDRISKGDIPPKVTDTYKGDFNEIKNNLNTCIDAVNALVEDANMLSRAAVEGRLDTRADASRHGGDFGRIVDGVNSTLDAVIGPLNVAAEYIDRISKGDIPPKITDNYKGDFNEIRNNLNTCIDAVNALITDANMLSRAAVEGKLDTRADASRHGGDFAKIIEGVNKTLDAVIGPLNVAAEYIDRISKGDIPPKVTLNCQGDFNEIKNNLNTCIDAVNALIADTDMLSKAALEGKLSTRADATKHGGDFAKIVDGVNNTLDAVIKPVNEAANVLKEMSHGNLKMRVNGDYNGDHAQIKIALNETLDSLSSYVREISSVLTEMANSNLAVEISGEYKGDFQPIKHALNLIIKSFNKVLTDLNGTADSVAINSRQVSNESQALSQGATEQASSIEELTAAITDISEQTRKNADNADEAKGLALTAKDNAIDGNAQMKEMLKAMDEINMSSTDISKIIKVIDEIAFQTNILALNAAVEAARAGQNGKGFAVVAEEVRNLAARSANAAKETTGLIEDSKMKVSTGTKLANETATALDKIVKNVSKAANIVESIATSCCEQAAGIAQINQGIEQVSIVVQTNSATAEETAAASEELYEQAEQLKKMTGKFKLGIA